VKVGRKGEGESPAEGDNFLTGQPKQKRGGHTNQAGERASSHHRPKTNTPSREKTINGHGLRLSQIGGKKGKKEPGKDPLLFLGFLPFRRTESARKHMQKMGGKT